MAPARDQCQDVWRTTRAHAPYWPSRRDASRPRPRLSRCHGAPPRAPTSLRQGRGFGSEARLRVRAAATMARRSAATHPRGRRDLAVARWLEGQHGINIVRQPACDDVKIDKRAPPLGEVDPPCIGPREVFELADPGLRRFGQTVRTPYRPTSRRDRRRYEVAVLRVWDRPIVWKMPRAKKVNQPSRPSSPIARRAARDGNPPDTHHSPTGLRSAEASFPTSSCSRLRNVVASTRPSDDRRLSWPPFPVEIDGPPFRCSSG